MKKQRKFEGRYEYENLEKQTICYCVFGLRFCGCAVGGGGGGAAGLVLVAVFAVPLFFAGVFWIY